MRKFEIVDTAHIQYGATKITLPVRATRHSVGYDFYSPIDATIEPKTSLLLWTNVKALFNPDEGLILVVTSGMGKRNIILANALGLVESDYYGNESNDGNLGFRLYNFGNEPYVIKKGDKIGQGFFFKYLTTDDEVPPTAVRTGGFGSTDRK